MDTPENRTLLSVAALVANGDEVDWAVQQVQSTDPHTSQVLAEMARVEQIAKFYRESEQSATTTVNTTNESHAITTWGEFTVI